MFTHVNRQEITRQWL